MNIFLYIDASGQSIDTRLWGIFMIIGQNNDDEMNNIIRNSYRNCENFCELKSKWLTFEQKKNIILSIQEKKIGTFYCKRYHKNSQKMREFFLHRLKNMKKTNNILNFYNKLKKTNQVKFISIVTTIESANIFSREKVNNISIYIDNENLPNIEHVTNIIEEYIASIMHKKPKSISVYPNCDSKKILGIQYVDVFLGYIREVFKNSEGIVFDL